MVRPVQSRPAILRRDGTTPGTGLDQDPVAPVQNPRSAASVPRALSTAARTTVGETNSVDQSY